MFCPICHRAYAARATRCALDGTALERDAPRADSLRCAPSTQTGAILDGRYAIRGLLGKGAMARVYLAEDLTSGLPVAIKILSGESAREPTGRERFLREAKAAGQIGHPNIVKTLASGQRAGGEPFLVLEFLFGESLGDLLRRDGRVEGAFGIVLMRQAASAFAAAHRVKIIHRDVKPDNLFLIGQRGSPYGLRVLDFGLAKLTEGTELTAVGMAVGTMEFMAPEQVLTDPVDGRADIYALGVVMYRMFAGRLPFDDQDDAVLLARTVVEPPPPPSTFAPGLDPRLEAVVLTCLRKSPANRYPTMEALLWDLERVAGDRPGALLASQPPATRDVFEPRGPLGKAATPAFYRKLGLAPP